MALVENLNIKEIPDRDLLIYGKTILNNPYVKFKPYPKQAIPIILANREETVQENGVKKPNSVLSGAGGFGGKTFLGSMLAVQYLLEDNYTCLVTRRNYAELLDTNSIWENLVDWCCDEDRLGDLTCEAKKSPSPQIIAPNGNTIYFKAFDREDKKGKFKSASYDRIINDEASELPEGILQFQYRSVRNTSQIPRSIINLSNPGGDSTDYLVDKFVDGDNPYVPLDWRDNPHIDREAYEGSLNELDYIDQQYQKYGNWHYKPTAGDLISLEELESAKINKADYKDYKVHYNVIGIDLAGEGSDSTALASLTLLENGKVVLTGLTADETSYPEETVYNFVDEQSEEYLTNVINFEFEPGSDKEYSFKYWLSVLEGLAIPRGIFVKGTPAAHSKYNRARPVARLIRNGTLFFDDSLDLEKLFTQFIEISPDKEVMKKLKSPDELDALGYAYMEIKKVFEGGFKIR